MERDNIIKALEICWIRQGRCDGCPYECPTNACLDKLNRDVIALITSQDQKNKELAEENERLRAENESLAISGVKEYEISQMLVYRIRDKHPAVMAVIFDTLENIKLRFAMRYGTYTNKDMTPITEVFWQLDKFAKEMLNEETHTD